ncbi:MAG: DUF2622 domain-containing protein [Gammaproteobacteria bacterium]|nr:DUF2622 domain-containing protein [Gammaproteobacteria bacterium]
MATFIVRIELPNALPNDYEILNHKMEQSGFSRRIYGNDGKSYALPTAEYMWSSRFQTTRAVRSQVALIINSIQKRNSAILVMKFSSSAWTGLKQLEPS